MTSIYPNQSTPSFLQKYTKNVFNRVHCNMHEGNSYDEAQLALQPYRSTPLILPGAKVYQNRNLPTESYLRHHPNPQMRAGPAHDYTDMLMKQKVAESVVQRVVRDDQHHQQQQQLQQQQHHYAQQQYAPQHHAQQHYANGPKVVHKQFNSPIGLYSDSNIENTIKNTVSPLSPILPPSAGSSSVPSPNGTLNRHHLPTKIEGYKKTVVYDPMKSETFRAVQENTYVNEKVHEVATPAQPRVFRPNRLVPGKKPAVSSFPPPDPISRLPVNSMGENSDVIHQSGSFKRLMYHVLGETEY